MVGRDEVDLRLDGRCGRRAARSHASTRCSSNSIEEGVVEVLARALEAVLERAVVADDLLVEAVEVLGVARLVDLLGGEERLLALRLVGGDQAGELRRHALLADEERARFQAMWPLSSSESAAQSLLVLA